MSHQANVELEERALELLETTTNHPSGYDRLLAAAVCAEDWDEVHHWVNRLEGELAIEHFHKQGMQEVADVY